jgi:regulator of sigma E protease
LSILVIVHELGHFIAAKLSGIRVLEFAIFMGPKLFSIQGKETKYTIRCIPIGGFVNLEGEEESSDDSRAYSNKPWYKRAFVILAGSFMNIVLALVIISIIFSMLGYQTTTIGAVDDEKYTMAYDEGIRPGDKLIKVNGMKISSVDEVYVYQEMGATKEKVINPETGKEEVKILNTYTIKTQEGRIVELSTYDKIGISHTYYAPGEGGIFNFIKEAVLKCYSYIKITLRSLLWLINGTVSVSEVTGPIGITDTVGKVVEESQGDIRVTVLQLMFLVVLISVNLGVFNLLPIPALDGGRLLFILIEAVRRKKIEPEKEAMVSIVGFALLILLAIIVAISDIIKIVK